jgi:putative hemolysin
MNPLQIIIVLIIGLLLSAFFSSSEIAFTAVSHTRLEKQAKENKGRAKQTLLIAKNFDQYSSALLFGNGLVNIFISSLATLLAIVYITPLVNNEELATLLVSSIMFTAIVIFGEIIPKVFGKQYPLFFVSIYVIPVTIIRWLFFPVVITVSYLVRLVSWVWIKNKRENNTKFTDDELEKMVDVIEEKGLIDEKKGDLIRSAIIFSDTKAYEVMTPRIDVYGFDMEESVDRLLNHPDTFSYSRIPVYDQTLDKIIGILPTKKLYEALLDQRVIDIPSLLLDPIYVPRTLAISTILKLFKNSKQSMAIVVDEHGGTEGLITLEDIIEEIFGEIWDETDEITEHLIKHNEYEYFVEGSMNIEDFFETLMLPYEPSSDYATVNGWVMHMLEGFAKVGDSFDYQHAKITVLEVEKFTVEKIKIVLPKSLEEEVDKES